MVTDNALSVDLGERVRFVADRNRRATYIFKGRILDPQLLTIARVDRHSGWNLPKVISDKRQTSLMLFDGSLALSLKGGVEQRKLPTRRRLSRHNAVLPTYEVQILGLVADIV